MNKNTEFPDVMVDIETCGLQPNKSHIIQICAVRFNLAKRTVDSEIFNRCLALVPFRSWDESTRAWWYKDKKDILQELLMKGERAELVMNDLFNWANPVMGELRWWSQPTSFDFPFVQSYFADYDIPNPFSYRNANDMNTYIRASIKGDRDYKSEPEFKGPAHNALYDTLHQIKVLFHYQDIADGIITAEYTTIA